MPQHADRDAGTQERLGRRDEANEPDEGAGETGIAGGGMEPGDVGVDQPELVVKEINADVRRAIVPSRSSQSSVLLGPSPSPPTAVRARSSQLGSPAAPSAKALRSYCWKSAKLSSTDRAPSLQVSPSSG